MGQIKLVTFDVAGTTAKDDGLVVKAATQAMEFIGVESGSATMLDVVDYVNATMGQRKIDVFMHLCNNDINKAEEAHDIFIESYISFVKKGELAEFDGISQLFKELKKLGIGVAITTGFPREILDPIISNLNWEDLIDISVAASEVSAGRPAPDMILKSIAEWNYLKSCEISPAEVLVIGDTESDIKSGIAAGATQSIGVLTGAHVKEQLERAGATSVLQSATQLLTLIN